MIISFCLKILSDYSLNATQEGISKIIENHTLFISNCKTIAIELSFKQQQFNNTLLKS
jgi:hypothetical protein